MRVIYSLLQNHQQVGLKMLYLSKVTLVDKTHIKPLGIA